MAEPQEVELKLELTPKDLRRLERSPLLQAECPTTDRLVSRYFDTADQDLHRAGYTLRVRSSGDGDVQTVKQEQAGMAGLFVRPEWERAIKGRRPVVEREDGPLAALVAGRRLKLSFTTEVRRMIRNVATGDALACRRIGSLWTGRKAQARQAAFLGALEKVQDHLGALNDQATAASLLARHGIMSHDPGKGRKRLLRKADKALSRLMKVTPFWD